MVGSDVTQPWHDELIEHSTMRVYGDVQQGGIRSDVVDQIAAVGRATAAKQDKGDWLTSVHPPAPMQR
jgi:hypothetical protein